MLAKISGVETERTASKFRKKKQNFCVVFTHSMKQAREVRKFHVAVVWGSQEMYKNACCICKVCCFSSLFLWSENFATMVTWRHTSPLYYITAQWRVGACSFSTTWISELIPFLVFCQPIERKTFIDLKPVNPVKPPTNSTLPFLIGFSPFFSWKGQKAMTSYALSYSPTS